LGDTLAPPPPSAATETQTGESGARRLVISAADTVRSFRLVPGSTLSIGRVPDNDVIIGHDTVSRLHARIGVTDRVVIEDAGSRNGIRVNGERVPSGGSVDLDPGAVVQIGPATLFLVEGNEAAEVTVSRRESAPMSVAEPTASVTPPKDQGNASIVLKDERMTLVYESAQTIASSAISVLVLGETGVGKEVLAYAIHSMSPRRGRPFVTFNSAALPESLVESELFGYARGAFTGADRAKPGLFEAADGGTIFLDEVADLSLQAQAKLLRVVETGEVLCVGGLKPRAVDVRVVSATNSDLYAMMTSGKFRRDLYYRLSGATLHIPPLRQRPADIPALVHYFAARYAETAQVAMPEFDDEVMAALAAHSWPGNVRELKNAVQRVALMAKGRRARVSDLQLDSGALPVRLPEDVTSGSSPRLSPAEEVWTRGTGPDEIGARAAQLRRQMADEERNRVIEALARAHGNQVVAARLLGVSRRTLINRLETFGLPRPRKGQR
jgi:transcriptional regulator with PAS, ATPase and Fis domain